MKTNTIDITKAREISGCNITLAFSKQSNTDIEKYVIGSLMQSFEKRNNICGDLENKFA